MVLDLEFAALGVFGLWLVLLTIFFLRLNAHYNNLISGTTKRSLSAILEDLLKEVRTVQKDIDSLESRYDTIEKQGRLHIQKVGLLRFNPFKDTGGDQSFVVALLNKEDSGVVISGLYSRLGTRWYAKRISLGKGVDHQLSNEEKKALDVAKS